MKNVAEIDKNLAVETAIVREGLRFYDAESAPFQIYGVFKENGLFRRMPEKVAKSVSPSVDILHTHGAGGRVCFVTDSPYVAIKTEYLPGKMPHFALTGSSGFDMYAEYNGEYLNDEYRGCAISDITTSVNNHLLVFAAEESRFKGTIVDFEEYVKR